MHNLRQSAFRAARWSALSELASRLIQPAVFVIMARLLTPRDYGLAAAAAIVLSFSQVLWEAGMGKAIIQRTTQVEIAADIAFWTNLALGLLVYGVIALSARWVAIQLFKEVQVAAVLKVQGLAILFGALGSVHNALFQKKMDFKTLFGVRVWATGAPALASIPIAAAGGGYWALVAGSLVGAALQSTLLWRFSDWRPKLRYDLQVAREMLSFGYWATVSSLLGWCYVWADSLLVGYYLDSTALGRYRAGSVFVTSLFSLGLSPILPVLFSVFSKIQQDRERLKHALVRAIRLIALVVLPGGAMLFALQTPVSRLVFGQRWSGIESVVGWLSLALSTSWLVGANPEAYRAIGRPDIETKILVICLFPFLAAYAFSLHQGLETFLRVRFAMVFFLGTPVHAAFAKAVLGLRVSEFVRQFVWPLVAALGILGTSALMGTITGGGNLIAMISLAMVWIVVLAIVPQWKALASLVGLPLLSRLVPTPAAHE